MANFTKISFEHSVGLNETRSKTSIILLNYAIQIVHHKELYNFKLKTFIANGISLFCKFVDTETASPSLNIFMFNVVKSPPFKLYWLHLFHD